MAYGPGGDVVCVSCALSVFPLFFAGAGEEKNGSEEKIES